MDGTEYRREYYHKVTKHKEGFKRKFNVRQKARYWVKDRQECSIKRCNEIGERHHEDYDKPLEIIWLCRKHHYAVHSKGNRYCDLSECSDRHLAKGLCSKHYTAWRSKGKPDLDDFKKYYVNNHETREKYDARVKESKKQCLM